MPVKVPLGISDFKTIIDEGFYYVDKTLFIEELNRSNDQVILIPRPRRFGKTLNLSMLQYFYEISPESNAYLFEKTAIWKKANIRKLQGTYPVIFLSFMNCKKKSWNLAYYKVQDVIVQEFRRHYAELSDSLSEDDHKDYKMIMNRKGGPTLYKNSLALLSRVLKKRHHRKVIILVDEYNSPILKAHKNSLAFMNSFFSAGLKNNIYLQQAILTGTTQPGAVGINNLTTYTLLDNRFSDSFGFTAHEVEQLLKDTKLLSKALIIKEWYNGYRCGNTELYSPISMLECIDNNGITDTYNADSNSNKLIKPIITNTSNTTKAELAALLSGATLDKQITHDDQDIWSLLLFTGYLTFTHIKHVDDKKWYKLTIPNREIRILLHNLISPIVT